MEDCQQESSREHLELSIHHDDQRGNDNTCTAQKVRRLEQQVHELQLQLKQCQRSHFAHQQPVDFEVVSEEDSENAESDPEEEDFENTGHGGLDNELGDTTVAAGGEAEMFALSRSHMQLSGGCIQLSAVRCAYLCMRCEQERHELLKINEGLLSQNKRLERGLQDAATREEQLLREMRDIQCRLDAVLAQNASLECGMESEVETTTRVWELLRDCQEDHQLTMQKLRTDLQQAQNQTDMALALVDLHSRTADQLRVKLDHAQKTVGILQMTGDTEYCEQWMPEIHKTGRFTTVTYPRQCSLCLQHFSPSRTLCDTPCHYHRFPAMDYSAWSRLDSLTQQAGDPALRDHKYYVCCEILARHSPRGCQSHPNHVLE